MPKYRLNGDVIVYLSLYLSCLLKRREKISKPLWVPCPSPQKTWEPSCCCGQTHSCPTSRALIFTVFLKQTSPHFGFRILSLVKIHQEAIPLGLWTLRRGINHSSRCLTVDYAFWQPFPIIPWLLVSHFLFSLFVSQFKRAISKMFLDPFVIPYST